MSSEFLVNIQNRVQILKLYLKLPRLIIAAKKMEEKNIIREEQNALNHKGIDDLISQKLMDDYNKLYRLAYSYVRNEEDAMDIVQESAYKAIRGSKSVKEASYISTWLYRIVMNTALDYIRKKKKEVIGVEDYLLDYEDSYEDFDVMNSLKSLEDKDRTVIILRFFEDLKISDIAEIMEENVNTVKTRLYRALKKLRVTLEEV